VPTRRGKRARPQGKSDAETGVYLRGGLVIGTTWDVTWQEVSDPDARSQRCFEQATMPGNIELPAK
jgi:hypothetical protein